jgi:hypothetical protein
MKKCLFNLYKQCRVISLYQEAEKDYGRVEFVRNYCAFCIKAKNIAK